MSAWWRCHAQMIDLAENADRESKQADFRHNEFQERRRKATIQRVIFLTKKDQHQILLHELVHLVEKTHNEKFASLMDKYMPMWREIKTTLNGQTLDYME